MKTEFDDIEKTIQETVNKKDILYNPNSWNRLKKELPSNWFAFWSKIGAIAAICILISGGIWLFNKPNTTEKINKIHQITELVGQKTISNPTSETNNTKQSIQQESAISLPEKKIKKTKNHNQISKNKTHQKSEDKKNEVPKVITTETTLSNNNNEKKTDNTEKVALIDPVINIENRNGCAPLNIQLSVSKIPTKASVTYSLNQKERIQPSNHSLTIEEPGLHTLSINVQCDGFQDYTESFEINVWGLPTVLIDYDISKDDILTYNTLTQKNNTYQWFLNGDFISDQQEDEYSLTSSGNQILKLIVSTNKGCVDSNITIFEHEINHHIFAPTAFSPNSDGNNDYFIVKYQPKKDYKYTFQVYNLSGELLFQTQNPEEGWKGKNDVNRSSHENKRYLWRLIIKSPKGKTNIEQGYFTQL